MNREHWLELEDLTSDDIEELISSIHPYLVDMEWKNKRDALVNEMSFRQFLFQSFLQMIEVLEKILDPEREKDIDFYYDYPKITQLLNYEDDIFRVRGYTMSEVMEDYGTNTIYATVESWWRYKAMVLN